MPRPSGRPAPAPEQPSGRAPRFVVEPVCGGEGVFRPVIPERRARIDCTLDIEACIPHLPADCNCSHNAPITVDGDQFQFRLAVACGVQHRLGGNRIVLLGRQFGVFGMHRADMEVFSWYAQSGNAEFKHNIVIHGHLNGAADVGIVKKGVKPRACAQRLCWLFPFPYAQCQAHQGFRQTRTWFHRLHGFLRPQSPIQSLTDRCRSR